MIPSSFPCAFTWSYAPSSSFGSLAALGRPWLGLNQHRSPILDTWPISLMDSSHRSRRPLLHASLASQRSYYDMARASQHWMTRFSTPAMYPSRDMRRTRSPRGNSWIESNTMVSRPGRRTAVLGSVMYRMRVRNWVCRETTSGSTQLCCTSITLIHGWPGLIASMLRRLRVCFCT